MGVSDDESDTDLMRRLARGEDVALNELIHRWRERLVAYLVQMTGNRATALDLAQEAFVRVYQSRHRYRPSAPFPAWIFRIAGNLARDHARWRRRRPSVPLDDEMIATLPGACASPAASAEYREEVSAMQTALAALPADLREAIVLFVHEGMSYQEIARVAGCSPKAVETRLYRARQFLRHELRRES